MAFGQANVTVGTTPTVIAQCQRSAYISNGDAQSIFIGGPNVTTANGVTLTAAGTLQLFSVVGKIYAVSVAGTSAGAVKVLYS